MASSRFECPACELVFNELCTPSQSRVRCPDCGTSFSCDAGLETPPPVPRKEPRVARPDLPLPTPRRVIDRRRTPPEVKVARPALKPLKVARPASADVEGNSGLETAPLSDLVSTQSGSSGTSGSSIPSASSIARRRSGSRLLVLIMTSIAAIAAVGGVLYVVVWQNDLFTNNASAETSELGPNANEPGGANPDGAPGDEAPRVPPMTAEQLENAWQVAAPYLVEIESQTVGGTIKGGGVIVDTRGWIATSLHLVAGASEVVVRFPSDQAADDGRVAGREVISRGIIAFDALHNLALISIPAVDVPHESDIVLSIDEYPAADAQLVAAGAPNDSKWLQDCHMLGTLTGRVGFFDDPDREPPDPDSEDETASSLMRLRLEPDARFDGGPLLRPDGAVAGILVGERPGWTHVHAVSVKHLRLIRDLAVDQPSSFSSPELLALARLAHPANVAFGAGNSTNNVDDVVVPGSIASRARIILLHERCQLSHWNPQTEAEYRRFSELASLVTAAEEVAVDESAEEGTRLLLAEPAEAVREELSETPWPEDVDVERINRFASQAIAAHETGVYCFARVEMPPGLAPEVNGKGTVVLSLVGTNQLIVLPVSLSDNVLTPGSEWLVIGSRQVMRSVRLTTDAGTQVEAPLVFAVYLIERPERIAQTTPSHPTTSL